MTDDSGAPRGLSRLEDRIDAIVGTREWVYLSPSEKERRRLAQEARFRADREALRARMPALRTELRDPAPEVRRRAAFALLVGRGYQLIGATELAEIAPVIGEALADASPAVRKEAAQQLIAFGPQDSAIVPALTAALTDPDPYVRAEATSALFRLGGPAALSATPALERDLDPNVRGEAARALRALGYSPSRVVDILIADLDNPDERGRAAAAMALGSEGPLARAALTALGKALSDSSPRVRDAARQALANIGPTP
jgi:HEAT repeat protein